ncbi:hypothetical protein J2858_002573 [Neorhizobium galegae]|uniref:hypothetical protein n=1 Tax=Rhizobium/Agrobacterium group TaxID=227290 RepID=UPI001AE39446|nr:hypothetical protein [Neorhizobium galegae]MBP2549650.1 hypothetical protein [Neorhizobium galegae]
MIKTLMTVSILSLGLAGGAVAQTSMSGSSSAGSDTGYGVSTNSGYGTTSGAGTVDPTMTYSTTPPAHSGTSLSLQGNCSAPVPADQVEASKSPVSRTQC